MDRQLIEALAANAVALDRLRRAAFGLDREDRFEIAERLSAEHNARVQRQGLGRSKSRRMRKSA